MTDKLDSLLSDLDARNGLGVRVIRNEITGGYAMLPMTVIDPVEWERQCAVVHQSQRDFNDQNLAYRYCQNEDDAGSEEPRTLKRC